PVKPTDVDLGRTFEQAVRNLSYQLQDKGVTVQNEVVDAPRVIRTDGELLNLILHNLLSNAVKYSNGNPVRLEARRREDGAVRLSVIDHGPGIEPTLMPKLFAPFQRGETHGQKGTGLGLSIVRQAADLLGAKLHVESQPGQGTQFHIDLSAVTGA